MTNAELTQKLAVACAAKHDDWRAAMAEGNYVRAARLKYQAEDLYKQFLRAAEAERRHNDVQGD